jgi:GNAT superfamily N-acetyltransferase
VEHARLAEAADLAAVAELWQRAVADLNGQRGGLLLAATLYRTDLPGYLKAAVDDDARLLVLGLIDETAVGVASVIRSENPGGPLAVIELIYVDPEARSIGVAEAMLNPIMEWCSKQHCVGVDAPALPGNRAAKAFFEGNGFLARLLVMHHPLAVDLGNGDG